MRRLTAGERDKKMEKRAGSKKTDEYSLIYRGIALNYSIVVAIVVILSIFALGENGTEQTQVVIGSAYLREAVANPVTWIIFSCFAAFGGFVWGITAQISKKQIIVEDISIQEDFSSANISDVARQLWGPVNAISDKSAIILGEKENEEVRARIMEMIDANEDISLVINEMVDLSMIISKTMQIHSSPYRLAELIAESRDMVMPEIKKKGLAMTINSDPHIPSMLIGDAPRIQQMLITILSNAVKYTDEGGVTLSVGMEPMFAGDIGLVVSVKDTGRGISGETVDHLFDSYRNAPNGREAGFKGTGLGMAIVKRLLDLMKGSVAVKSELGSGTEFILRIPQRVYDVAEIGEIEWQEEMQ